jgi:predicted glycosyltransferase
MASECAMLGTPAYFLDPVGRGYTDHQEKLYELVKNYSTTSDAAESTIISLQKELKELSIKKEKANRHNQLINDVIDPVSFFLWLVIEYPTSMEEIIKNPEIIKSFK